ncbi:hypothetical protein LCGC14_0789480 [marine sediment metagenome]|uniref:DUF4145 domain-containing protein n=1 Tax=marine sediment metagenome TaxID=412755 RepID=A0A0F9PX99_9ZZZZ
MPDAKFLEEYQLYRKFEFRLPSYFREMKDVNINMFCPNCKEPRTFRFLHKYKHENKLIIRTGRLPPNRPVVPITPMSPDLRENNIIQFNYICASCENYNRIFSLRVGKDRKFIEKVGQYPPWDINIERDLKEILKNHSENYKKGKICESQSYGIGAFAYYRRIIEDIIGELLEAIQDLLIGEELEKYQKALEGVKKTNNTAEKISLVKDLLPPILKTEQFNPLKTIHDALSKGLHGRTDEECLEDADSIRTSLVFLVDAVLNRRKRQQEYTESMKKIIEKQRKKIERN